MSESFIQQPTFLSHLLSRILSIFRFSKPCPAENPFWLGAVQMSASCPSVALNNVFLGQVELTGKPTNAFSTLSFPVPANVRTALGQAHTDCFLGIAVNMNAAPTTPVLDNLRFAP